MNTVLSTCEICKKAVRRVARRGCVWSCAEHFPSVPCGSCGAKANPVGVTRFGIVSADGAEYDREQEVGYRCPLGHLTAGEVHMGPGWPGWTEAMETRL